MSERLKAFQISHWCFT